MCWEQEQPEEPKEKDINFRIREHSVNQIGDLVLVFPERLKTLDHFNLTLADLRHGDYFEVHYHSNVLVSEENDERLLIDDPVNEDDLPTALVPPELINWNVTEFTAHSMSIKLDLSQKLYVSTGEGLDTLFFKLINNTIFVTENDAKMSNLPQMYIDVQRQMVSEEVFE